MRKQSRWAAVLSVSVLLALGGAVTAYGASGWQETENGQWRWYDSSGNFVRETWKSQGDKYYYLDENGVMAVNRFVIDDDGDKYYVGEDGVRYTNQWLSVPNEDEWEKLVLNVHYYFGPTGKAYTDRKTIGGRTYIFDEEGRMYSGWHTYTTDSGKEYRYYLGSENEGWAYNGWQMLKVAEDMEEPEGAEYDDEEWFWFDPSGRAMVNKRKYINGHYYAFDVNGVMMDRWIVGTPATAVPDGAYYYEDAGNQGTRWIIPTIWTTMTGTETSTGTIWTAGAFPTTRTRRQEAWLRNTATER